MMNRNTLAIIILLLFSSILSSYGQDRADTLQVFSIETKDGNRYYGKIVSQSSDIIVLNTDSYGEIFIKRSDITKISLVPSDQKHIGKFWPINTRADQYFLMSSAYNLKKGEGYYQNNWVLLNKVNYGLTNNFSIGVGIIPLFLFTTEAAEYSPLWISPKLTLPIKKEQFNIGVGGLFGNVGLQSDASFGYTYGMATIGNRDENLTIGLGYGFADGEWAELPLISLSFMSRMGKKGYIVSEIFLIPTDGELPILLSLGGRTLTRTIGIDYGLYLLGTPDDIVTATFPWLGITVPFK